MKHAAAADREVVKRLTIPMIRLAHMPMIASRLKWRTWMSCSLLNRTVFKCAINDPIFIMAHPKAKLPVFMHFSGIIRETGWSFNIPAAKSRRRGIT